MRVMVLYLAACTAACSATSTLTRRYTGQLTPTTPSSLCRPSRAVLTIQDSAVLFTPDEGTWRLTGTTGPGNALTADHTVQGADKKPYATRLDATWTPERVQGTYNTPRCAFTLDALS